MLHRHLDAMRAEAVEPVPKPVRKPRKAVTADEKIAVSVGTRNVYPALQTMSKGLFAGSDVDRLILFTEDDDFPLELPEEVETVNVRKQTLFHPGGPNYQKHWTYMALMKVALTKYLPDVSRALMLDYDTVIVDDISELFLMDLEGCYWGGVPDRGVYRAPGQPKYFNAGVCLMDYDLIRYNGIDDMMIDEMNRVHHRYIDKDVLNMFCTGRVKEIPLRFNESMVTGHTDNPAIVHYAGANKTTLGLNGERRHYYDRFAAMSWERVREIREVRYGKFLRI